ncbi:unnamed protein product [Amoebophrya sp. A120]|nr:unnamed protein product [Amoebophrya sp. A120]|eukprot:GSA120T00015905001.1
MLSVQQASASSCVPAAQLTRCQPWTFFEEAAREPPLARMRPVGTRMKERCGIPRKTCAVVRRNCASKAYLCSVATSIIATAVTSAATAATENDAGVKFPATSTPSAVTSYRAEALPTSKTETFNSCLVENEKHPLLPPHRKTATRNFEDECAAWVIRSTDLVWNKERDYSIYEAGDEGEAEFEFIKQQTEDSSNYMNSDEARFPTSSTTRTVSASAATTTAIAPPEQEAALQLLEMNTSKTSNPASTKTKGTSSPQNQASRSEDIIPNHTSRALNFLTHRDKSLKLHPKTELDLNAVLAEFFYVDWTSHSSFGQVTSGLVNLKKLVVMTKRSFTNADMKIHISDAACTGNDVDGYKTMMPDVVVGGIGGRGRTTAGGRGSKVHRDESTTTMSVVPLEQQYFPGTRTVMVKGPPEEQTSPGRRDNSGGTGTGDDQDQKLHRTLPAPAGKIKPPPPTRGGPSQRKDGGNYSDKATASPTTSANKGGAQPGGHDIKEDKKPDNYIYYQGSAMCYVQYVPPFGYQYIAEWLLHDELSAVQQVISSSYENDDEENLQPDEFRFPSEKHVLPNQRCRLNYPSWGWKPGEEVVLASRGVVSGRRREVDAPQDEMVEGDEQITSGPGITRSRSRTVGETIKNEHAVVDGHETSSRGSPASAASSAAEERGEEAAVGMTGGNKEQGRSSSSFLDRMKLGLENAMEKFEM